MVVGPNPHRPVMMKVRGNAHTYVGLYRSVPKSVPLERVYGPRREPMEEVWAGLRSQLQEALDEGRRGGNGERPREVSRKLNKHLEDFTVLAENELAAGHDIFAARDKFIGRCNIEATTKPVLGWRTREKYQASSQAGAR